MTAWGGAAGTAGSEQERRNREALGEQRGRRRARRPGGEAPRSPRSLRQPRRPVLPLLFKDKSLLALWQKKKKGGHLTDRENRRLAGDRMRTKKTPGVGESWPRVRAGGPEWGACREPLALCEPRRNPRRPRTSAEPPGSDSAHPRPPKPNRKGPCVSSLQAFSQPM